jgi:hypothetical protein
VHQRADLHGPTKRTELQGTRAANLRLGVGMF